MAITVNVSGITINTTAGTGTITDASVYTSPTRATVGVFVKVYKIDHLGAREALVTTSDTGLADTAAVWTFTYPTDGRYKILYVAAPDYSGAVTYAQYDAVFNPTSGGVFRSKSAGNIGNALNNTTFWEPIPDPATLAFNIGTAQASPNLNTNTSVAAVDTILFAITKENFGTKASEAFLEASSTYRRSQDVRTYELLGLAVDGMNIANDRQEYQLGEIIARRAISLCSNC